MKFGNPALVTALARSASFRMQATFYTPDHGGVRNH
jgi:hypothetical protein